MVDITPKRCESVGCKYAANFGDMTQRTRRFCARHKLGGMLSYQELVSGWAAPRAGGRRQAKFCCYLQLTAPWLKIKGRSPSYMYIGGKRVFDDTFFNEPCGLTRVWRKVGDAMRLQGEASPLFATTSCHEQSVVTVVQQLTGVLDTFVACLFCPQSSL